MAADDPTVAFDECARQLYELEMTNTLPADQDAMRAKRQALLWKLQLRAGDALRYGEQRSFSDFNELERRIQAVVDACVRLQQRPLEYVPERPECYVFSGGQPLDIEAARARAANEWRLGTCGQLVGQVQAAIQSLAHIWIAIGGEGKQGTDDEPALGERRYDALDALYKLKAFAPDGRATTANIAERVGVDAAALKEPIADLVRRGLAETKKGRGGGVWLTKAGRELVERQRKR